MGGTDARKPVTIQQNVFWERGTVKHKSCEQAATFSTAKFLCNLSHSQPHSHLASTQ